MTAVLAMALMGCSGNLFSGTEDKNTVEAKAFDVSQKLDKGDYASILSMPAGSVNPLDYAAAAMGSAGLSPTTLIDALNNIGNSSSSGGGVSNSSDMSSMTGLPITPSSVQYIDTAVTGLNDAIASNPTDPELNFQLTLTSLVGTISSLGQVGQTYAGISGYAPKVTIQVFTGTGLVGFDPLNGIDNTEAAQLANFIKDVYISKLHNTGSFVDNNADTIDDNNQALLDIKGTPGNTSDDVDLIRFIARMVGNVRGSLKYANLGGGSGLYMALSDMTSKPGGLNFTCWVCDVNDLTVNANINDSGYNANNSGNHPSCVQTSNSNDPAFNNIAYSYGEKLCVNGNSTTADPVTDQDIIDYLTNVLAQ